MSQPAPPHAAAESVGLWSVLSAAILAQQVGSKTVRDGLFLAEVSAEALPRAMLMSALLSVPMVLGTSRAMTRFGPRRVAAGLLGLSSVLFGLSWLLLERAPALTAWIAYLHIATLGGTTISAFFSNVSEQFDPHRARHASSRVISGAAVGGVIGGLGASSLARAFGQRELFLVLALINVAASVALALLPPSAASTSPTAPKSPARWALGDTLGSVAKSGYLRSIAILVLLTGFTSALLDFNFKLQAATSLGKGPELLQLFAAFHTGTAIVTALVQLIVAQPALERLGLAGTLAALPGSLLLGGALGAFVPRLWSTLVLRGVSSVLESSLFRSAYEPLYTPLSQHTRRSTKTLIDVAAGRLGEATGSAALLMLALVWPRSQLVPALAFAMLGAAAALFLSIRMHSGYVAALAASLRKGSIKLHQNEVIDSTTRLTLSQTHMEIERGQLLAEIAAHRASKAPPPPVGLGPYESAHRPAADSGQRWLVMAAEDLLSGDHTRVKQQLTRGPLDPRLVPFAIGLLEQAPLVDAVSRALGPLRDRCVGQLLDALRDPAQPLAVRRRLPRILRHASDPRAAAGLLDAMRARETVIRHRAASALALLTSEHPDLAPSVETVFAITRSELQNVPGDSASLQHLFTILSLALDRDALRLAQEALASSDVRQRGTALEYLHSTLPEPLRSELEQWLETRHSSPPQTVTGDTGPAPRH
ncbi:MAG: MFS transporter [Polyangiales bacterium]